jgi:hypothetical protein
MFASKLRDDRQELYRYSSLRQVSQVWNGREWIDTVEARQILAQDTRDTRVNQETTDDN